MLDKSSGDFFLRFELITTASSKKKGSELFSVGIFFSKLIDLAGDMTIFI